MNVMGEQPTNHLDIEGLDALMQSLKVWNGGGKYSLEFM